MRLLFARLLRCVVDAAVLTPMSAFSFAYAAAEALQRHALRHAFMIILPRPISAATSERDFLLMPCCQLCFSF